jgi:uncharacterized Rmd1/YagE family protein
MNALLTQTHQLHAYCQGSRIDTRGLEQAQALSLSPLVLPVGNAGRAIIFRFGVVVFVDANRDEEAAFCNWLGPFVKEPFEQPEDELLVLRIQPEEAEGMAQDGVLVLPVASLQHLQLVAHVLAKSTVLAYYESQVAIVFDRVEKLAKNLGLGARFTRGKVLLQEIANTLLIQMGTVGRVEVSEKPELTWDDPALDKLYKRCALEYELEDRDRALSRKLELIATTAETYLDLLHNRQALRVEWYIVILIVVEIALTLFELFILR